MRRRIGPEQRREELVAAAERVLRRLGGQARVEDVVREAGAAQGTFYTCFRAWDDLLETVRERQLAAFEARLAMPTEVEGPVDWPPLLRRLSVLFVDFVLELQGLHEALFHGDFSRNRPMHSQDRPPARLAAIIRAGQEAGAFGPVDPDATGRLLFAVLHETADAIEAGADRQAALAALHHLIDATLAPPGA